MVRSGLQLDPSSAGRWTRGHLRQGKPMGAPTPISSESSRTAHCPDSVKVAVGGGCTRSRHGEEIGLSDDGTRSGLQHASRRPQAPGRQVTGPSLWPAVRIRDRPGAFRRRPRPVSSLAPTRHSARGSRPRDPGVQAGWLHKPWPIGGQHPRTMTRGTHRRRTECRGGGMMKTLLGRTPGESVCFHSSMPPSKSARKTGVVARVTATPSSSQDGARGATWGKNLEERRKALAPTRCIVILELAQRLLKPSVPEAEHGRYLARRHRSSSAGPLFVVEERGSGRGWRGGEKKTTALVFSSVEWRRCDDFCCRAWKPPSCAFFSHRRPGQEGIQPY